MEVQRRTPDGWKVDDLIGRAALDLDRCDTAIPLDDVYRDLVPERDDPVT